MNIYSSAFKHSRTVRKQEERIYNNADGYFYGFMLACATHVHISLKYYSKSHVPFQTILLSVLT